MATMHWFRSGEAGLHGHGRDQHVWIRQWGIEGGPVLQRARCFASSGEAEARMQACLAGDRGPALTWDERRRLSDNGWWGRWNTSALLAAEVASAPDEPQRWRDYADWLWRHSDGRAGRIELGEALAAADRPAHRSVLLDEIAGYERAHGFAKWFAELQRGREAGQRAALLRVCHGQLIGLRGWPEPGMLRMPAAPVVLADLELELTRMEDLDALAKLLLEVSSSLTRLRLDSALLLNPERAAWLIDQCWRLPRLRTLELRTSPDSGGGLTIGSELAQALGRLLGRQRAPICGMALRRLELELVTPREGWQSAALDELTRALARSELDELSLSADVLPNELRQWIASSELAQRLVECRLVSRTQGSGATRSRVPAKLAPASAAPKLVEPTSEGLLVWSDWLMSHGDPVGELSALQLQHGTLPPAAALEARQQIEQLQARIRAWFAAGYPDALVLSWRGPLLERVELIGDACPDPRALLHRVLGHPAGAHLRSLAIRRAWGTPVERLLDPAALGCLGSVERLELESEARPELSTLLERLPGLHELVLRTPGWQLTSPVGHERIDTLGLSVPCDFGRRALGRMFARLSELELPALKRLALDFEPGRAGPAISFGTLELPWEVELRVSGVLRTCDADELRRWASWRRGSTVEVAALIQTRRRVRAGAYAPTLEPAAPRV